MYSETVVERHLALIQPKLNFKLERHPIPRVEAVSAHLTSLLASDGKLKRPLTPDERTFITNERILSKFDFSYWMERYSHINLDGSVGLGIGHPILWESQQLTLKLIAKIEGANYQAFDAGDPCDGILIVQHKSRQLGATTLARLMTMHRLTCWEYTRALAASVDEKKVNEQLYGKDHTCLDNLPWYMKPRIKFDVKNAHLAFEVLNSYVMYQQSNQVSGLGQGAQYDVSHLTEVASWDNPSVIRYDFIPTIPQSRFAFCILESTANGRGNWWHTFTEEVRRGQHRRWHYAFWPWYVCANKYRAKPPVNWNPAEVTLLHAKKVHDTSHQFLGRTVDLEKQQLFWWESEYQEARAAGELNLFLTNFAESPETSFQHSTLSAFSTELLEEIRLQTTSGASYELVSRKNVTV